MGEKTIFSFQPRREADGFGFLLIFSKIPRLAYPDDYVFPNCGFQTTIQEISTDKFPDAKFPVFFILFLFRLGYNPSDAGFRQIHQSFFITYPAV
jgi:hypothetical protein